MSLQSLALYILSLSAILTACWLVLGLVKTFRFHFLSSYLGYLVAMNIAGLLNLFASDLFSDLLRNIPPQGMQTVYILFGLAAFPLLAIALYFFLSFIAGILDKELSFSLRIAYIILWTVLFTGFLTRIQFALKQRNPPISQAANLATGLVILVIPVAALIYLLRRTSRSSGAEGKKGLTKFAVVSLVCYVLFLAALVISEAGPLFRWAVPFFLFLANISPVLVLKGILSRFYRPILPGALSAPRMKKFRDQFQLSNREGEILDLLLRGKKNREIERDLFVSPHTVRNHIHNIYQKLGIGSRLQLMNLIRTWLESKPDD